MQEIPKSRREISYFFFPQNLTKRTNQNAFSTPEDQEIVAFYTTCEGPNVFSDQLVTAYIQGTAAQGLLDALDDDNFASVCPDEVCVCVCVFGWCDVMSVLRCGVAVVCCCRRRRFVIAIVFRTGI